MWQYIAGVASICSPIVAALHAALYEAWKDWVLSTLGVRPFVAGLIASITISGIGIAVVCLSACLLWFLLIKRVHAKVRNFYFQHIQSLMTFLEQFRWEINTEIDLFSRLKNNYNRGRWEKFKFICDKNLAGNNLLKTDLRIEKYLREKKSRELSVVTELRHLIRGGLRRLQEILGAAQWDINTIHRAEETVADVNRHLEQFRGSLLEL